MTISINPVIITLPNFMNFKDWADAVVQDLSRKQIRIDPPNGFKDWRDWFNALQQFKELGDVPTITKNIYPKDDDWKRAAMEFINNIPVN